MPRALIQYVLRQAHQGILQNPWNHIITMVTVALAVSIFSAFLLLFHNAGQLLDRWQASVEVTVYLSEGLSTARRDALFNTIKTMPGVIDARKVSEEEALRRFKAELGPHGPLLQDLSTNPLPASIELRLDEGSVKSPEKVARLIQHLDALDGVDDIQSGQEWVERLAMLREAIGLLSLAIGGGLLVAVVFIISNTIKLTVYSREEEIEIMRLVGATDAFIEAPFIIEGMLQGGAGTILALGILAFGYQLTASLWNENLQGLLLGMRISFLPWLWVVGLMAGGILVGGLGSFLALVRFLQR